MSSHTIRHGTDSHRASVTCAVPAEVALAFLADGVQLGHWALGCLQTEPVGNGVVRGRSLFDDQLGYVRPVVDEGRMTVVYHVGATAHALSPRISAVVERHDSPEDARVSCRIELHATRAPEMDDARWTRLVRCHEVEVLLIQAQLERRAASSFKPR